MLRLPRLTQYKPVILGISAHNYHLAANPSTLFPAGTAAGSVFTAHAPWDKEECANGVTHQNLVFVFPDRSK